jgi:RHS repeat-associated protein
LKTYFLNGLDVLSDGTSKFLHGAGIDQPLQVDSGTLSASYLQDRLGSTSQLVDSANGSVKTRYDYKSYGKLEGGIANPESRNPFTYTAREDDGTGLMYYRARYYDPELEMFVSQDPLGQAQRYVQGNPLRFRDPRGLQEEFDPFGDPRYEDPNEALEEYEREHALDYSGPNVFPNGNQSSGPITEDPCPEELTRENEREMQSGRLKGYNRGNITLPGGQQEAINMFRRLTGQLPEFFPKANPVREQSPYKYIDDNIEINYRHAGNSGQAKIEIINHHNKTYTKYTFW